MSTFQFTEPADDEHDEILVVVHEPDDRTVLLLRQRQSGEEGFITVSFSQLERIVAKLREHYPNSFESLGVYVTEVPEKATARKPVRVAPNPTQS